MFVIPSYFFWDLCSINWSNHSSLSCFHYLIRYVSYSILLFRKASSIKWYYLSKAILLPSPVCFFIPSLQKEFFNHLILFVQAYLACFLISSTFTSHRSLFNHRIFVIQGSRIWQRCPPRQIHQDNIVEHETSGKQPQKYGKTNIMIILPLVYSKTQQLETLRLMLSYFCDVWSLVWLQSAIKS